MFKISQGIISCFCLKATRSWLKSWPLMCTWLFPKSIFLTPKVFVIAKHCWRLLSCWCFLLNAEELRVWSLFCGWAKAWSWADAYFRAWNLVWADKLQSEMLNWWLVDAHIMPLQSWSFRSSHVYSFIFVVESVLCIISLTQANSLPGDHLCTANWALSSFLGSFCF